MGETGTKSGTGGFSRGPKIEILFEDDQILAVNKPYGLPVHPTMDPLRPSLQGLLEKERGQKLVLFHRLDLDTTGIVLLGKDPSMNAPMNDIFKDRQIRKIYWAVVDGKWDESWREVETFIGKINGGRYANLPARKGGAHAHTSFRVLATNGLKTLIEAHLHTGRTHQIRLHCLEKNHPILGDKLYGRAHPGGVPIALHARETEFVHPKTKKSVKLEASLPDYWNDVWLKGLSLGNLAK